jgi:signal transduction histidine kinase
LNAREVAAGVLLDIRNMAVELRPTALDDLGLAAAVRKYAANFQERIGITVSFTVDPGVNDLNGDLSVALYRIVQESLTNAARHSGATAIKICLEMKQGHVELRIADNGQGMADGELEKAARENRLGIYGMRERVELCGGAFHLESVVGTGTTIIVSIPVKGKGEIHDG